MKSILAVTSAILLLGCERPVLESVEIVEFGRFETIKSRGISVAPNAIAGTSHAVETATLLESTTDIPAKLGTSFGIRVKFVGGQPGVSVPCTAKCFHPNLTDPVSGRSSEVEEWENFGTIGSDGYIGYTFDNEWELASGRWTIQIYFGSKLMAEKTFNVFAPPSG